MTKTVPTSDYQILLPALDGAISPALHLLAVVNAPLQQLPLKMAELFLGFICLYLVEGDSVHFKAASDTEQYRLSIRDYPSFDPNDFLLPLHDTTNDIVRAVVEQTPIHSVDWNSVKRKEAADETVRLNQASSGIAAVYVYPFIAGDQRGALMFNYYQYAEAIGQPQLEFMKYYTSLVATSLAEV